MPRCPACGADLPPTEGAPPTGRPPGSLCDRCAAERLGGTVEQRPDGAGDDDRATPVWDACSVGGAQPHNGGGASADQPNDAAAGDRLVDAGPGAGGSAASPPGGAARTAEPADAGATVAHDGAATVEFSADEQSTDVPVRPPAGAPLTLHGAPPGEATLDLNPPGDEPDATPPGGSSPTLAEGGPGASGLDQRIRRMWGDARGGSSPSATLQVEMRHLDNDARLSVSARPVAYPEGGPTTPGGRADYRIEKFIARGGMGRVYLAQQTSLGRQVALKTLSDELAEKDRYRRKFFAEASITGLLDHPNIVPIHDLGVRGDGVPFYSMKFVTGEPWSESIRTRGKTDNLGILLQVADGVAFAHSRRILHRDLKPENVMLGGYGEVLVVDWGLAVHLDRDKEFSLGGTPLYMAPEMASHRVELIDERSDVYLLGAMLFELLEGRAPHDAGGETVTERLLIAARNQIVPHRSVDELIDVALRAMATRPQDRYADVRQFQQAVRRCQRHADSRHRAERAAAELAAAKASGENERYARALFAYQDAIDLWPENRVAEEGLRATRLAYAGHALAERDYGLGLSLLTEADATHQPLRRKLLAAQQQQRQRGRRLRLARNAAVAATVATVASLSGFAWFANNAAIKQAQLTADARASAGEALRQGAEAIKQAGIATRKEQEARRAADLERRARQEAVAAKRQAEQQRQRAEQSALAEKRAAQAEKSAKQAALRQQRRAEASEAVARRRAFVAEIALSAADLAAGDTQAADDRLGRLEQNEPSLLGWEAARLAWQCHRDFPRLRIGLPVARFTHDGAGQRLALVIGDPAGGRSRLITGRPQATTGRPELDPVIGLPGASPTHVAINAAGWLAVAGRPAGDPGGAPLIAVTPPAGRRIAVACPADGRSITALALSPAGDQLAVAHRTPTAVRVEVVDLAVSAPELDGSLSTAGEYALAGVGRFTRLAFSADGLRLAAVEQTDKRGGGNVTVWSRLSADAPFTGKAKAPLPARSVAFLPTDSAELVAGLTGGGLATVRLVEGGRARLVNRVAAHTDDVVHLAFVKDGSRLATASVSGVAKMWARSAAGGLVAEDHPPIRHAVPLAGVAWAGAGAALITADADGLVRVWPRERFYDVRRIVVGRQAITSLQPDDRGLLLVADAAGHAKLVDPRKPGEPLADLFVGHPGNDISRTWPTRRAPSPPGDAVSLAFNAGRATLVRRSDAARFELPRLDERDLIDLSPGGEQLAIASLQELRLVRIADGRVLGRSKLAASSVAVLEAGLIAVGDARGRVSLLRAAGAKLASVDRVTLAARQDIRWLAADPSRRLLYAASDAPRPVVFAAPIEADAFGASVARSTPLPGPIKAMAATAEGVAVRAGSDGRVWAASPDLAGWSAGSPGDLVGEGPRHAEPRRSPVELAFRDRGYAVTIARDGRERLWDMDSPSKPVRSVEIAPGGRVCRATLSATGGVVAALVDRPQGAGVWLRSGMGWRPLPTADAGGLSAGAVVAADRDRVAAWDPGSAMLSTWRPAAPTKAPVVWSDAELRVAAGAGVPPGPAVALGPAGAAAVATATPQGGQSLLLWSAGAAAPSRHPLGRNAVTALAFTPSGRRLLAGTETGRIVVYDVSTTGLGDEAAPIRFAELTAFAEHRRPITTLRFGPAGKTLLSGDSQGVAIAWPAE